MVLILELLCLVLILEGMNHETLVVRQALSLNNGHVPKTLLKLSLSLSLSRVHNLNRILSSSFLQIHVCAGPFNCKKMLPSVCKILARSCSPSFSNIRLYNSKSEHKSNIITYGKVVINIFKENC